MQDKLNQMQAKLAEFTTLLEKNLQDIIQQAVDIPQQIKDFRSKIIKKLDQLVDKVTSECGQLKKQQTTEMEDKITSIRSQGAAITASRSLLEAVVKHGTETQAFVGFNQIQEQFGHYQQRMEEFKRLMVTMEVRLTVNEALSDLLDCTSLAEVCAREKSYPYVDPTEKETYSPYVALQRDKEEAYPGIYTLEFNEEKCLPYVRPFEEKEEVYHPDPYARPFEEKKKVYFTNPYASPFKQEEVYPADPYASPFEEKEETYSYSYP